MESLCSQSGAPETFKRCQLCGHNSTDICDFWLWTECDEEDKPMPGTLLITCRQEVCSQVIEKHERLYIQEPWSAAYPGAFILICGDCPYRAGGSCTHPNLKANGGEGLQVWLGLGELDFTICCGARGCFHPRKPAVRCEGLEESPGK